MEAVAVAVLAVQEVVDELVEENPNLAQQKFPLI